uniref:U3 small nucleolar RNA-associated protein 20 n=1 Tax=Schistosoma haematobium TaxID=6185 RepID=A0A094ZTP5_SCHHA
MLLIIFIQIAIHYLFGLLHVQFTAIWSPINEAIASYCESNSLLKKKSIKHENSSHELEIKEKNWNIECRNLFWSVFQPLLMDTETKIVHNNNEDLSNVSDSKETNLYTCSYETAIIWFTSIRPDLYSVQRKTPNNHWLVIESRKCPDWLSYRLCLWQCLRWKIAAKYTHFLTPLLLNIISSAIQSGLNKSTEQLLLTILNLYSQFNNIKSIYMEKEFKQNIYQLLKFKQPTIQNAAFKCLLAYKQSAINNYQEQIEKIINPQTFRDAVRTFRLDTSLYSSEHREQIGEVLLRILYGRLQLSKGQFTSAVFTNLAQYTNSELNLFLSFLLDPFVKETECIQLSTSTFSSTAISLSDCIQSARQRVQHTIDGKDTLSWSRLHALSQIINQTLNYMGHRLNIVHLNENEDDLVENSNPIELSNNIQRADILLRLALSLLAMVYEVKKIKLESTNHNHNRLPLTSQLKAVRLAAINLLVHLFSSNWLCEIEFWGKSTITDHDLDQIVSSSSSSSAEADRSIIVKEICCNTFLLNDLIHSSTLSLNHLIIQLCYIWSKSTIYNGYLCKKFFNQSLLDTLFKLLNMNMNTTNNTTNTKLKLKNEIIEKLVEIIHNLTFLPDVSTTGRVLLQSFHSELVNYLNKRLQELCQVKSTFFANLGKKPQSGLRLQREFQLVSYLAQLPSHSISNNHAVMNQHTNINCLTSVDSERLLQALLQLLQRSSIRSLRNTTLTTKSASFKHRVANNLLVNSDESAIRYDLQMATGEVVEAELIQSILHLVQITTNITEYLKKILDLFVCSKSRIARSLLCQVVGVCTSRLTNWPMNLIEMIEKLNKDTKQDSKEETDQVNNNLRYFKKYLSDHNQSTDAINNLTQNVLLMLNSWDFTHIDQPDIHQRANGYNLLIELCILIKINNPPEQLLYLHQAGLNCAIYTISHDELHLRDIALDYTIHCIESIQSRLLMKQKLDPNVTIDTDQYYHELIIKCLWLNLMKYLQDISVLSSTKRLHLLRLLNCIIRTYQLRRRFYSLALLLDNYSMNNDFYMNLQSGTLIRQCCAIRRLALFLHNPLTIISRRQLNNHLATNNHSNNRGNRNNFPISQKDLRNIFLPIIWFYLESEFNSSIDYNNTNNNNLLDNHKKLIDYCLDAIEGIAKHFDWKYYRFLIESIIHRLNSCINIHLISQIMIRIIDAFQPPKWNTSIDTNDDNDDDDDGDDDDDREQMDDEETKKKKQDIDDHLKRKQKVCTEQGENSMILNYMLNVIKRLEPFIIKPIKTNNTTELMNNNNNQHQKKDNNNQNQPLKISLVISLVMLLRRLPSGYLESRLPHLILRIMDILRPSRDINYQIRYEAIKSLSRIGRLLGPSKSLDKLFDIVHQQLDRGGYTYWQVRLYTLHRVFNEVEQAIISGEVSYKSGQLDYIGRIMSRLYLDEMIGRLAEEIDSRRSAKLSNTNMNELNGSIHMDLPEGNGFKSPEGVTRLCRLLSNKVHDNLEEITITNLDFNETNTTTIIDTDHHHDDPHQHSNTITGWYQPQSKLLEPRWKYLELDYEPKREYHSLITQSGLKQSYLLVCCGLSLFIGLIRYQWLKQDQLNDLQLLNQFLPSIITCLQSKYIQVLNITIKCIRLFLLITSSKSIINQIPKFSEYIHIIGNQLFNLLSNQSYLFSNKIGSISCHAQYFTKNLYCTLALLVNHQYNYPLSKIQLLTLLNIVDIELTHNQNESMNSSLTLFNSILKRRLRDPIIQTNENDALTFIKDPNLSMNNKGLIIAKLSDHNYDPKTGSGGGQRLLNLFYRLQLLSITSSSEQIRKQSCNCLITFLLNYPHQLKFLQQFLQFYIKQLEYKKSIGRLSAIDLLHHLIDQLPITRFIGKQNQYLDEMIFLNVSVAIERESSRKCRRILLNFLNLLFNKLPLDLVHHYLNDYILSFLIAPPMTRCSARLLSLQIIISLYNSPLTIVIKQYRNQLIDIISNDILPCGMIQLDRFIQSNTLLMISTGLNELYNKRSMKTPKEECNLSKIIKEDAKWMSEIELPTNLYSDDDDDDDNDDDTSKLSKDHNEEDIDFSDDDDDDEVDNVDLDYDEDTNVDPFTSATFNNENIENNKHSNDTIQSHSTSSNKELKCSKSAIDNQYFLVAHTLEHALKLVYQLITESTTVDSPNTSDNNINTYISSIKLSSFWRILLNGPKYNNNNNNNNQLCPITEFQSKKHRKKLNKRREQYSTLFSMETTTTTPTPTTTTKNIENKTKKMSLLIVGHRETREWATRCLNLLLKLEIITNQDRFIKQLNENNNNNIDTELSGLNLQRILNDSLFQLEVDARVPISEEWSNALLSNLIYLGQLLHLSVGRKPVLRIFRIANKIALDELNNRPQYYCQRLLALKLTTGLLLRLPHPNTTQLFDMFSLNTQPSSGSDNQSDENPSVEKQVPAYFAYLRSASKLISREFRQRERLAFTAASSLASGVNDDTTDIGARIRLRGMHLSRELTVRAKSRQRRAQARLRRALMSGTIRPESANSLVASVSAGMAKAGPDQLVELIESTESALTQELGGGNHQLIQIICSRASLGARAIRERRNLHKATRNALGMAWNGPVKKKSKLPDVTSQPVEMNNSSENEIHTSNRLQKRKLSPNEEHNQKATQHKKTKKPRITL